jgi:hypothetical protein
MEVLNDLPKIYYPYGHASVNPGEVDFSDLVSCAFFFPTIKPCVKIEVCKPYGGLDQIQYFSAVGYNCIGQCHLFQAFGYLADVIYEHFM